VKGTYMARPPYGARRLREASGGVLVPKAVGVADCGQTALEGFLRLPTGYVFAGASVPTGTGPIRAIKGKGTHGLRKVELRPGCALGDAGARGDAARPTRK
jgi:hypothetical protein